MFQDLPHFIGMALLLSGVGTFVERIWSTLFKYLTNKKDRPQPVDSAVNMPLK